MLGGQGKEICIFVAREQHCHCDEGNFGLKWAFLVHELKFINKNMKAHFSFGDQGHCIGIQGSSLWQ